MLVYLLSFFFFLNWGLLFAELREYLAVYRFDPVTFGEGV